MIWNNLRTKAPTLSTLALIALLAAEYIPLPFTTILWMDFFIVLFFARGVISIWPKSKRRKNAEVAASKVIDAIQAAPSNS